MSEGHPAPQQQLRGRPFEPGNPGRKPGSRNRTTRVADALLRDEETELALTVLELAVGSTQKVRGSYRPAAPQKLACISPRPQSRPTTASFFTGRRPASARGFLGQPDRRGHAKGRRRSLSMSCAARRAGRSAVQARAFGNASVPIRVQGSGVADRPPAPHTGLARESNKLPLGIIKLPHDLNWSFALAISVVLGIVAQR
jgi:hypothetical protein